MPYSIVEFQPTPNPNALKCVLDRPLPGSPESLRSFRDSAQAAGDPLGHSLMALPGVTSVLISTNWLTVNKNPDAGWTTIKKAVQKTLAEAE
jgi:hypothetical protein